MPVNKLRLRRSLAAVAAAVWLAACAGDGTAPASAPPPDAKRVDESKAGRVSGRVLLEGEPPAAPSLNMDSDPVCARQQGNAAAAVAVQDGGLDNVFVYVKDGLGNYYFDAPSEPVKVDQKGCHYVPHVFGVRVGQPVEFANSDPTVHNVRADARVNRDFNFTQPMAGMRDKRTFTAPEVMVRLKCDVHPWMSAYAGVMEHPYFAVTTGGGRFELKSVPAGTYTVEAWHEKLGTRTQQVTLGENESKELTFSFRPS